MSTITLEAELRTDLGKGASRRLRRLEQKIPAIVYGGTKAPQSIHLLQNKVNKALESESIYSSVFPLVINGKSEQVILKSLQRHPYKPVILHMDFQRVSKKDVLIRMVPLHFMHEDIAEGVKVGGGMVSHALTQVEVRCEAQALPEFIEVDLSTLKLDEVLHLSQLVLPKGVYLATDLSVQGHDLPVVSIHKHHVAESEETASEEPESAPQEAPQSGDAS